MGFGSPKLPTAPAAPPPPPTPATIFKAPSPNRTPNLGGTFLTQSLPGSGQLTGAGSPLKPKKTLLGQ